MPINMAFHVCWYRYTTIYFTLRFSSFLFLSFPVSYLSNLLSLGIDNDSRLPFFIADGVDDCAIAVEFRRLAAVNARLPATCKAALALRRRGGESFGFPAKKLSNCKKKMDDFELKRANNGIVQIFNLPFREIIALRLVPADVRSDLAGSLAGFRKSLWLRDRCVRSFCECFVCFVRSSSSD